MKIVVGMSGGVDSSVAALLLAEAGHEVIGLSLGLFEMRGAIGEGGEKCCSAEARAGAAEVCRMLGIPHHTIDARAAFAEAVIEPFGRDYLVGVTPNPCILCNCRIKFPFLLKAADDLGAEAVATGHYARILREPDLFPLLKGVDPRKDQSYFLYAMTREERSRVFFPLGNLTKAEVRKIAEEKKLPTAARKESQEICFVGSEGYEEFIKKIWPEAVEPGPILDTSGRLLGEHKGIGFHTVGQRRGLGVGGGERLYVVRIERETRTVVLGRREEGMKKTFTVREMCWIGPEEEKRVDIKIRSTMPGTPGQILPLAGNRAQVRVEKPQWAPSPGQAAVFYDGDRVVGGGVIEPPESSGEKNVGHP